MTWTDSIDIDAPADVAWGVATAVTEWPRLMPTMTSVERLDEGPLQLGSRARIKQPGQRPAVWAVHRFEPGRAFAWSSVRRGLTVTGTHVVDPLDEGSRSTLVLEVGGPMAAAFRLLLGRLMRRTLRIENAAFKAEAEKVAAGRGSVGA